MSYKIVDDAAVYVSDPERLHGSTWALERVDLPSFEILGHTWARDRNRVWADGIQIRKVFAPTFRMLNECYGRDNECVFERSGRILKGICPAFFQPLDSGLYIDADSKHWITQGYARYENAIYHYRRSDHKTSRLRGAAAGTFEVLAHGFARDHQKVFHGLSVAKGANPAGFRAFSGKYWTDGTKVFYYTSEVRGADAASFEYLGNTSWARDRGHVYSFENILEGPDPSTARLVGDLIKDASHVYSAGGLVADADPATFQAMEEHRTPRYYRDGKHVFYWEYLHGWVSLTEVDLDSFRMMPKEHWRAGDAYDAKWVYRAGRRQMTTSDFLAKNATENQSVSK